MRQLFTVEIAPPRKDPDIVMTIPGLTVQQLQDRAASGSFVGGQRYYENGAVVSVKPRPTQNEVAALVKGRSFVVYAVRVRFGEDGITDVHCSCPRFGGGWCKHVVAALLHQIEATAQASAPSLAGLNREELLTLLGGLVAANPELAGYVEQEASRLQQLR